MDSETQHKCRELTDRTALQALRAINAARLCRDPERALELLHEAAVEVVDATARQVYLIRANQ